jgi:hypothetical protein
MEFLLSHLPPTESKLDGFLMYVAWLEGIVLDAELHTRGRQSKWARMLLRGAVRRVKETDVTRLMLTASRLGLSLKSPVLMID